VVKVRVHICTTLLSNFRHISYSNFRCTFYFFDYRQWQYSSPLCLPPVKKFLRSLKMRAMIYLFKAEIPGMCLPGTKLNVLGMCSHSSWSLFYRVFSETITNSFHLALRVDSIPVGDDDLNDTDEQAVLAPDNNLTMHPTDNNCQCQYLFCKNCLPSHLLLKGCWYEERTPEKQQQEIACEVEHRRQQGINEAAPFRPVVRVRHHPDGTKLVFRSRGMCFTYSTWSTHTFITVIQTP
jgi:hypothetical protein